MTNETLLTLLQILSHPEAGTPVLLRGAELLWGDQRFPFAGGPAAPAKVSYLQGRIGLEGIPPQRLADTWNRLLADGRPLSRQELLAAVRRPPSPETAEDDVLRRWRSGVERMLQGIPAAAGSVDAFAPHTAAEDRALRLELRPLLDEWPRRLLYDPWWATAEAPLPDMRPLPLDEVWVDLQMLDPGELPDLAGLESLRSLLDQRYEERRWQSEPLALVLERLQGIAALVGPPGCGKTTLIKWIARHLIRAPDSRFLLPLFVPLRRYALWRRDGGEPGLLRFGLHECGVRQPEQKSLWIQVLNELAGPWRERVLVLLDGWDEVPLEQREPLFQDLQDLSYGFSVLITSRPAAFPARLAAARVWEVADMAPESIEVLIRRWFRGAGEEDEGEELLRHLDFHPDLRRLARNPFLLTLLCGLSHASLRRAGGILHGSRSALYAQTLQRIYSQKNEKFADAQWDDAHQRQVERLALWLLAEAPGAPRFVFGAQDVVAAVGDPELLPRCLEPSRLLARLSWQDESRCFLHATFQEYLAACALKGGGIEAARTVARHVHDPAWQEVFHFLADEPGAVREAFWREMASLAAAPDRFGLILVRLARWVVAAGARDGGQALLGRDLRDLLWPFVTRISASQVWLHALADLDPVEFVERAGTMAAEAAPRLRARLQRAIGRIRGPAASRALVADVLGGDAQAGAVAASQFRPGSDREGLRPLRAALEAPQRGEEVRRLVARALGYARDGSSVPALVRVGRESPALAEETVRALGRIGGLEATEALSGMLGWSTDVAWQALVVRSLGEIHDAAPRDLLLDELARRPGDDALLVPILNALAEIPIHRGSGLVVELLGHDRPEVRQAAVWALAAASGPGVFEGLSAAAQSDPDEEVRLAALEAFQLWSRPVYSTWVLERITDESKSLQERSLALRHLLAAAADYGQASGGEWLAQAAVEQVLDALADPEGSLALEAAAQAHRAGSGVAPRLVALCGDETASPAVRELACGALGRLAHRPATATLLRLVRAAPEIEDDEDEPLSPPSHRVARAAAEALVRIDAGLLLREPGSTAFYALARFAVESGCLVYDDRIVGPDGREWARAPIPAAPSPRGLEDSGVDPTAMMPPDLEMRVRIETLGGKPVLTYLLHSAAGKVGLNFKEVRGPELAVDASAFARLVFDQIEKLHEGFDVEGRGLLLKEAAQELEDIGHWLYDTLFPPEMKALYRRFRKNIDTLQITSEEATIPWELVKPYDDSDRMDVVDDDFLCMQFQLTRWLAGTSTPRLGFQVRRLACLGGMGDSDGLVKTTTERQMLASLALRYGIEDASPAGETFADLRGLLEMGGVDLLHFMGHGDFDADRPAESKVDLADRPFRARNLSGPLRMRLRDDRPLVVFNACRVGRQGWSLSGLDGWTRAWVERCECGAFLGPQWLIKDSAAYEFSRTFYGLLEQGRTLGEAAKAARQALRELDAGRPNWLAFAVYGHPNARVTFGATPPGRGSGPESRDSLVEDEGRERGRKPLDALRRNSNRVRSGLEPYLLPRLSRREVHEKYLPAIRESVVRKRSRIIPILGSAGYGKSTLLGEIFDALRAEDFSWTGLVNGSELSYSTPTDLSLSLSKALCGAEVPFEDLAVELSHGGAGVLLIDTLDLLLSPALVPHLQRLFFDLADTATTVVFTCRDVDYQYHLEPPRQRLPQVADRVDRYAVPAFTQPEVAQATQAFVASHPRLRGTPAGEAFVATLLALTADSRSLQSITSNPLLLAMLCEVFGPGGDLPRDLTVSEIYERYWDEKVGRSRTRGPADPATIAKSHLCLHIARHLVEVWHEQAHDGVAEPDLALAESAAVAQARDELLSEGILQSLAGGRLRFFHQTFLEYAMARWLATATGAAALERILRAVRESRSTALHWWPVLRQLLVLVEATVFVALCEQLPSKDLAAFRALCFAAVTRGDAERLEGLCQSSLQLGAEFQKTLCSALEGAPARALEGAWSVVEAVLRDGTKDAAITAATVAHPLLTRDRTPPVERLAALLDAVEERMRRSGDREGGAEIVGQFLRATLPVLKASSDPGVPRFLQDRYSSFGENGRRAVIELFRTARFSLESRAEFVRFLQQSPPERRLRPELIELLEQVLRFEGSEKRESVEERIELLYRPVPEPWTSFHARAVARIFGADPLLAAAICRHLLSDRSRSPRCDTNALEEMVQLGQADTVCESLAAVPPDEVPAGRIGALSTLVRELSSRATPGSRGKLAHWLKLLAQSRPEEAFVAFAAVADADDGTWGSFVALLRNLSAGGMDALIGRALREVSPASLVQLDQEIAALARRNPSTARFALPLVDLYALHIGESEEAVTRLVGLGLSDAKGLALAAANALVKAVKEGARPPLALLLPLMGSRIAGVRDHLMDAVIAIQQQGLPVIPDELVQLCDGLAGDVNAPVLQKLCKVVASWVRNENRVPPAVARKMADLALRPPEGGLGPGVAGALIRALKVLAQLEAPEIDQLLQPAARLILESLDLSRLSAGEAETIDLLAALARADGSFLSYLVDDGPNLHPRNVRALAAAIRRVEGAGSRLIPQILDSEWCPPQARRAILDYLGA